jgi:uncharacterized protein YukJ
MPLRYGYAKARIVHGPTLRAKPLGQETQYHQHLSLDVGGATWDVAINVGTDDADDLLRYRLAFDFHHPIVIDLDQAPLGPRELTGGTKLPALDFMRSDILAETGDWRDTDPMDGSEDVEPVASLGRLLASARDNNWDIVVFGRFYEEGGGLHDVHMNQGSLGAHFQHRCGDDSNDHNDVWQDGALLVKRGGKGWAAYFSMFTQQSTQTDDLGNPIDGEQ